MSTSLTKTAHPLPSWWEWAVRRGNRINSLTAGRAIVLLRGVMRSQPLCQTRPLARRAGRARRRGRRLADRLQHRHFAAHFPRHAVRLHRAARDRNASHLLLRHHLAGGVRDALHLLLGHHRAAAAASISSAPPGSSCRWCTGCTPPSAPAPVVQRHFVTMRQWSSESSCRWCTGCTAPSLPGTSSVRYCSHHAAVLLGDHLAGGVRDALHLLLGHHSAAGASPCGSALPAPSGRWCSSAGFMTVYGTCWQTV